MSVFSECPSYYAPTIKGFGMSPPQEQTIIFKGRFQILYRKSMQEYGHVLRKKCPSKKHQVAITRMCSPKEHDDLIIDARVNKLDHYKELLYGFYEFSRPHTTVGTIMGVTSVSLLALNSSSAKVTSSFVLELVKAIIPSFFMNLYAAGLNQIYDVELDKINKPYLPLASGVFSMKLGVGIVLVSLIMSLGLGIKWGSPALFAALVSWGLLGSIYSIELLNVQNWKKNPFLAAMCIVIVRSIVVQLACFIHVQKYVLGKPLVLSRGIIFATSFMFFFSIVIALFKDIPDMEGDELFGYRSFSVTLGLDRVFWLCICTLMTAYGSAMAFGVSSPSLLNKIVTVSGHFTLASILMYQALKVNITTKGAAFAFYMFIWKLFYAEYLLIPFLN